MISTRFSSTLVAASSQTHYYLISSLNVGFTEDLVLGTLIFLFYILSRQLLVHSHGFDHHRCTDDSLMHTFSADLSFKLHVQTFASLLRISSQCLTCTLNSISTPWTFPSQDLSLLQSTTYSCRYLFNVWLLPLDWAIWGQELYQSWIQYPQSLTKNLIHGWYSINIGWRNKWLNKWINK